jgi:hypothetical protein
MERISQASDISSSFRRRYIQEVIGRSRKETYWPLKKTTEAGGPGYLRYGISAIKMISIRIYLHMVDVSRGHFLKTNVLIDDASR